MIVRQASPPSSPKGSRGQPVPGRHDFAPDFAPGSGDPQLLYYGRLARESKRRLKPGPQISGDALAFGPFPRRKSAEANLAAPCTVLQPKEPFVREIHGVGLGGGGCSRRCIRGRTRELAEGEDGSKASVKNGKKRLPIMARAPYDRKLPRCQAWARCPCHVAGASCPCLRVPKQKRCRGTHAS